MAALDLRPLSLGEILDRTFSLYRSHFLLFVGITAIPQLAILAVRLAQLLIFGYVGTTRIDPTRTALSGGMAAVALLSSLIATIVYVIAYLYAQGGTVLAVSELYLGRPTTIGESFGRMRGRAMNLFGVTFLNGIAVVVGLILLIVPGVWLACRLITCVPAALLEDLGARDSLERSYRLTEDSAGRAFVIYFIYFLMAIIAASLFTYPFDFMMALSLRTHPDSVRMWLAFVQVGNSIAETLVTPILLIATAVFYYDLRVRKEAFDLQLMMNPGAAGSAGAPPPPGTLPSMLS
ncbi:MAG TPA: glycerophosphoryl diester phosphodiesterase membrane domain-containing protein [Candidatus Acidoferrales bacterium]|nr:glycerophosphoryl diester phosphodiesterase membrane domain-containing protein [Candidatus Acidoferrales bacterium]